MNVRTTKHRIDTEAHILDAVAKFMDNSHILDEIKDVHFCPGGRSVTLEMPSIPRPRYNRVASDLVKNGFDAVDGKFSVEITPQAPGKGMPKSILCILIMGID